MFFERTGCKFFHIGGKVIDEQKALPANGEVAVAQETDSLDIQQPEEEERLFERWKDWTEAVDR